MLSRLFDRQPGGALDHPAQLTRAARQPRHSGGWDALRKHLVANPGLSVLDVGLTSAANINLLTEMGHNVYMADLLEDAYSDEWRSGVDEDGKPVWDVERFVEQNLSFSGRMFDVVLLWMTLDYLPEPLIAPVVSSLHRSMTMGGQMLAFFNTKLIPDLAPYYRLHLTATDDIELQLAQPYRQQRALTNRNIERLFADWSGLKQFLAKDGVSESILYR